MVQNKKKTSARVVDRSTRQTGNGETEDFPNKKPVKVKRKTINTDEFQYKY